MEFSMILPFNPLDHHIPLARVADEEGGVSRVHRARKQRTI